MKFLKTLGCLFICGIVVFVLSVKMCTEKSGAALKALHENAENQLVAAAGEGEVALKLLQNQYSALKERLVKIKTLKRSMERRIAESEATSARLEAEGKDTQADLQRTQAERYRSHLEKLKIHEMKSEEALKSFATDYQEAKMKISIVNEMLESTTVMGGLSKDLKIDSSLNTRMETVQDLIEKLQVKLDRAESIMEVNEDEIDY